MPNATAALGHTAMSTMRGVTAKYVGESRVPTYISRLQLPDSNVSFDLVPINRPIEREREYTPAEFTGWLAKNVSTRTQGTSS